MRADGKQFEDAQADLLAHYGTEARSRFVDLAEPGLRVHLLEAGEGSPVVLLHGGGGMAVQTEPLLGRLSERHRVIAPDRPGCGLTESFDYRGVDFRRHGSAFVKSLLDAEEIRRASIVAASISGVWAIQSALDHPDRIDRVALVGSPAGLSKDVPIPLRLMGIPGVGGFLRATIMRPSEANVRRQFDEFVSNPEGVPEEMLRATLAAISLPGAHESFGSLVESVVGWRGFAPDQLLVDDLPRLERPVLMIWGTDDHVYPPSVGEEACSHIPEAQIEVIPGAGHFVWMDDPERVSASIESFLA